MQLGFDDVQASFCRGVNEVKKKKKKETSLLMTLILLLLKIRLKQHHI